jgi:glycosyltransferase involved in cell wall biosynthesis
MTYAHGRKITFVTDAWSPQINGVVRTLQETMAGVRAYGYDVQRISPEQFFSMPCPTYPEIRLALTLGNRVGKMIQNFTPDHIHISTEGPLGIAARRWCVKNNIPFTTAFHTRFPDYAAARTHLSPQIFWRFLRWFHRPSRYILTATPRLMDELLVHGLVQARAWSRGVDTLLFRPDHVANPALAQLPRPIMLNVGRMAVEKNLEAFLGADAPGTKVLVGDGPAREALQKRFPDAVFPGPLSGAALAATYASADVFVFPSLTDTFGLVMLEALACGTPVAAFPVAGPLDVIGEGRGVRADWTTAIGCTDSNLATAINMALRCDRRAARAYAMTFNWRSTVDQFLAALVPIQWSTQHVLQERYSIAA